MRLEELEGPDEELARHTIQYGKAIIPGRFGELPGEIVNSLFYNAVAKPYSLALVGVKQFAPATYEVGFLYAAAYSLNVTVEALIEQFKSMIYELGDSFFTLGGGEANKFDSAEDLVNALHETFVELMEFTTFTEDISLIPIVTDLIYLRFEICAILFDSVETSEIKMITTPFSNSQIVTASNGFQTICIFKTPNGYYPMAIINKRMYSKYPQLTRRIFRLKYESTEMEQGIKPIQDTVAETLIDIVKSEDIKHLSLASIKEFVAKKEYNYNLVTKLIGITDKCYAVILTAGKVPAPTIAALPLATGSRILDSTNLQIANPAPTRLESTSRQMESIRTQIHRCAPFGHGRNIYTDLFITSSRGWNPSNLRCQTGSEVLQGKYFESYRTTSI